MFVEDESFTQLNSRQDTEIIYQGCDFGPMWFEPSILMMSAFLRCTFDQVDFIENDFIMTLFFECRFEKCTFRGATFRDCRFLDCTFTDCAFSLGDGYNEPCKFDETNMYASTHSNCTGIQADWPLK